LLDPQVGLPVEGLALAQQLSEAGGGVDGLQQGPRRGIAAQSLQQQRFGRIQPHHHPLAHVTPVFRPCYDPSAGGHHQRVPAGDLAQHRRFQVAKPSFPVAGKNFRDGAAGHLFDRVIGIEEAVAQGLGQGAAHRTLAGSHHPDQIEVEALKPLGQGLMGGMGGGGHASSAKAQGPFLG
jgi:hypothetical protein